MKRILILLTIILGISAFGFMRYGGISDRFIESNDNGLKNEDIKNYLTGEITDLPENYPKTHEVTFSTKEDKKKLLNEEWNLFDENFLEMDDTSIMITLFKIDPKLGTKKSIDNALIGGYIDSKMAEENGESMSYIVSGTAMRTGDEIYIIGYIKWKSIKGTGKTDWPIGEKELSASMDAWGEELKGELDEVEKLAAEDPLKALDKMINVKVKLFCNTST